MNTIEKRPTHPLPADALRAAFEDQGLVAPPVPAGLAPGLRELGLDRPSRIVSGLVRASVDEALLIAARQDPDGPFAEEDPR